MGTSLESTGCKCSKGYGGKIKAVTNGYYYNGAYDGACVSTSLTCGNNIGFSASGKGNLLLAGGWSEVTAWKTEGNYELYNTGHFDQNSGRFTPPAGGYYLCSTQLRIDSFSSSYTNLVISFNGAHDVENGMATVDGDHSSTDYRAMSVSGVVKVTEGDYLSVWVQSVTDNSWYVQAESGFSCHKLKSAVGFHADKDGNMDLKNTWTQVGMFVLWQCFISCLPCAMPGALFRIVSFACYGCYSLLFAFRFEYAKRIFIHLFLRSLIGEQPVPPDCTMLAVVLSQAVASTASPTRVLTTATPRCVSKTQPEATCSDSYLL